MRLKPQGGCGSTHHAQSNSCLWYVDDFFVEYVGREHAEHLVNVLKKYHTISEDWTAKKFVGIDLEWNYAKKHADRTCRLSMKNYINELLFKLGYPKQKSPRQMKITRSPFTKKKSDGSR